MMDKVSLEYVSCALGCPCNDEIIFTGHDRINNLPGEFTVVKCKACDLMRTNPRPTPETIGFYYPDDYGPYIGTKVIQANNQKFYGVKKLLKPTLKKIFKFNTNNIPSLAPGRMLELGCASGSFLHRMAELGWQVQGIEFSDKAAIAASQQGYHVHAGSLETAPAPDEPFDLIVGWMVLEHLHDPINCLNRLREWSKPGAWLVLSIPNAGSLEFSVFKDKWYAMHLPNHLFHFSPQTLEKVLLASGWKIDKVFHQRVLNNLIASVGYMLCDKGFKKLGQILVDCPERALVWNVILFPLAWLLSLFGQTGRMTIWARIK